MKVAIYPGSFNPWHTGHDHILAQALKVFDKVIIAIGKNPEKSSDSQMQSFETITNIQNKLIQNKLVEVITFEGLLVDFVMSQVQAHSYPHEFAVIKGLRNIQDFEYEKTQQYWNEDLGMFVPTYYIISDRFSCHISSSAIRAVNSFTK